MSFQNTILNLYFFFLIPIFVFEFYYRDPTIMFLPKMTICFIIIGFTIWYFFSNDESDDYIYNNNNGDQNAFYNGNNNYNNRRYYCYQMDTKTYEKIRDINTTKETTKLYQTPQFKKMYEEKGDDFNNWNWQSRERLQNIKPLNESDIGSEDIENMSIS